MTPAIRRETLRALTSGAYTLSAQSGRRRARTVLRSISHVRSTPLVLMAAIDPRRPVFDYLAESRAVDVTIGDTRRVLHCLVRHIVRVDDRAIVMMEVVA